MIPKIIHQIFWDLNESFTMPANGLLKNRKKIKEINAGFEYQYWNKVRCQDLVRLKEPKFYETFQEFSNESKFEYCKFLILYTFGGVYIDMDIEPNYSINSLVSLEQCEMILFQDSSNQICSKCLGCASSSHYLTRILYEFKINASTNCLHNIFSDVPVLPITAIDINSRKIITQISKQFLTDKVIVFPQETMLSFQGNGLFGHCNPDSSLKTSTKNQQTLPIRMY